MRWLTTSKFVIGGILLAVAVIGAAVYFRARPAASEKQAGAEAEKAEAGDQSGTMWTCAMHPNIQLPHPGKCPICGMDLIPITAESHPWRITFSKEQAALAGVEVSPAVRMPVYHQVYMTGKISADERRIAYVTAWVGGRLDRLYVDFTGTQVRKGDHLVYIYSPQLVRAQRDYLSALRGLKARIPGAEETYRAVRDQLLLLGLTEEQIKELERTGEPSDHMTIYSPIGGVVIEKRANEGQYVQEGSIIYVIADLSTVWALLDAFESDLLWIHLWQTVEFTTEAYPGEVFQGKVAFVDPVLNEQTRTVRVRLNVENPDGRLRPGMFVRGTLRVRLDKRGWAVPPDLRGKWLCPMHPEVVADEPGTCPICGMELARAEELGYTSPETVEDPLVIPASAVLWTGRRAVVYVQVAAEPSPVFEGREVILGPRAGDYWVVLYGLSPGELVVTEGNFKIDASLQIQAKRSMMSPEGGQAPAAHTHHGHGGQAGAAKQQQPQQHIEPSQVPDRWRAVLTPIYEQYLTIVDALAADKLGAALAAARNLQELLGRVPIAQYPERIRKAWGEVQDELYPAVVEMTDARTLQAAREPLKEISRAMIHAVQMFGHALDEPLYQIHCPMAGDTGADWLQRGRQVRNPYFGSRMLRCGEIRATYEPIIPLEVSRGFLLALTPLYRAYLRLVDSFRSEKLDDIRAAARALSDALNRVGAEGLNEPARLKWTVVRQQLGEAIAQLQTATDVASARSSFKGISAAMVELATRFGHVLDKPIYVDHCPMVFRRKGAYWLQTERAISNPYAPSSMPTCGEIMQVVPPNREGADREERSGTPARKKSGSQQ